MLSKTENDKRLLDKEVKRLQKRDRKTSKVAKRLLLCCKFCVFLIVVVVLTSCNLILQRLSLKRARQRDTARDRFY